MAKLKCKICGEVHDGPICTRFNKPAKRTTRQPQLQPIGAVTPPVTLGLVTPPVTKCPADPEAHKAKIEELKAEIEELKARLHQRAVPHAPVSAADRMRRMRARKKHGRPNQD